ncbi:MAG: hypothetical protein ACI9QD_001072, partial [Thermoproteota archaeon]
MKYLLLLTLLFSTFAKADALQRLCESSQVLLSARTSGERNLFTYFIRGCRVKPRDRSSSFEERYCSTVVNRDVKFADCTRVSLDKSTNYVREVAVFKKIQSVLDNDTKIVQRALDEGSKYLTSSEIELLKQHLANSKEVEEYFIRLKKVEFQNIETQNISTKITTKWRSKKSKELVFDKRIYNGKEVIFVLERSLSKDKKVKEASYVVLDIIMDSSDKVMEHYSRFNHVAGVDIGVPFGVILATAWEYPYLLPLAPVAIVAAVPVVGAIALVGKVKSIRAKRIMKKIFKNGGNYRVQKDV